MILLLVLSWVAFAAEDRGVASPSGNRIARYEPCENCAPSIAILDREGKRVQSFRPMAGASPCVSIVDIFWLSETRVAAECHINPSTSEYVETDLETGKTVRDLLGFDFTPSPDGKSIAHVGGMIHFAPPPAHSYSLQIDNATVYPAKGADAVRKSGSRWIGIHEFASGFVWSPDSARVAFVDCLYDWVEDAAPVEETHRRCQVAVVSRTGRAWLFPIDSVVRGGSHVTFSWDGAGRLAAKIDGAVKNFQVPER